MRPVIAKVLELGGKTYLLPLPSRYQELVECARALGIKDAADEKDMRTVGYRSLIGVVPKAGDHWLEVEDTAERLSMMTPAQLDAITKLCAAFGLTYRNVGSLLNHICYFELHENGIPIKNEGENV